MPQDEYSKLKEQFARMFGPGGTIHIVRAPGRVNLIGEHTDYNDGFVFPMAIEPQVLLACRARGDDVVKAASTVYPNEFVEFSLRKKIERGKPTWGNYVRGVAAELIGAGIPLSGMDALFSNTLPVGGGLSSSAAIEVGTGRSLLLLAGLTMEVDRMALICQKAEHEYAHVPCGIMDQMIVAGGKPGNAMLLDCRDLSKQYVAIDPKELRVVIVNSMVHHEHSGGEYAMRRKQCEEAVAILNRHNAGIKALRDVTMQQVDAARGQMSELVYRRCRHVVGENDRTTKMAQKLSQQHYDEAGELMVESHISLRDDYEVSCAELDYLVDEAIKVKGVYGARMTGGGFGGCIVALVQPRSVEILSQKLHQTYTAKFDRQPSVFVTSATAGASVIEQVAPVPNLREILLKLCRREDLTRDEAREAFLHIMSGEAQQAQIGGLLVGLAAKGTTVEELVGAATVMREKVIPVGCDGIVLDTCGTGGDVRHTFNISTAAALIAAGAGARVVKHGNRSASGRAGSADVLEKLGLKLEATPETLARCLEEANICFAFARLHHPAMKFVSEARKELGIPTIFNLLGPLTNPGRAQHQLLGVFAPELTDRMAAVLREMGSRRAWVVHAEDGLDEISTIGPTRISELRDRQIHTWTLDPAELNLPYARLSDLQVNSVDEAAAALLAVLNGDKGPHRDISLLNAAAALVISEIEEDLPDGLRAAEASLETGNAKRALDLLIQTSQS